MRATLPLHISVQPAPQCESGLSGTQLQHADLGAAWCLHLVLATKVQAPAACRSVISACSRVAVLSGCSLFGLHVASYLIRSA